MYKSQMKFQKIVCFMVLIASAIVFIYSLGMVTELYETLNKIIAFDRRGTVEGTSFFTDIQPFNKALTKVSIALILVSVFMLIMNTHTRRKYYVGNYVAIGLSVIVNVASSIWALVNIVKYENIYLTTVDFEAFETLVTKLKKDIPLGPQLVWVKSSYFVFGFLLLTTVLLVVNLIWKLRVMDAENKLVAEGKEKAIA